MRNYSGLKLFIFFLYFLNNSWSASAVHINGTVTDMEGLPVPFASVYIEGSSKGTTTNIEGKYTLDIEPGRYRIIFRFIGYRQRTEEILIEKTPLEINVTLSPETYQLAEVKILAGAEDPAYAIIRKAQARRKNYLRETKEFQCRAYVKSTQRLESYPKKILGQKVEIDQFIDTVTKIFYLSESVSEFSFKQPDHTKEEMISSTLSGNPQGYSFNQASDLMLEFYENLIRIGGLTPRGVVSPISASALFYYDYQLEGTFVENGVTVNKIKVIPKRKNDPVFSGDIFITDDSWRIHSLDLMITRAQQLQLIDTFRIRQSFLPVDDDRWMLFNTQYSYHFNVFGFVGNGIVLGIFSEYNLHPEFPEHYFDGQVMKVRKESNLRDSLYWNTIRPVPLTLDEKTDYRRKDSTRVIYESKAYMDSIDKKNNKFKLLNVIGGYEFKRTYQKTSFAFSSLLDNLEFNTVDGLVAGFGVEYNKASPEEKARSFALKPELRYGFSSKRFQGSIGGVYRYDRNRKSVLKAEAGDESVQFNGANPVSSLLNSTYSLLARKNYMKLYEKRFGRISHESEIFNGLRFGVELEYADRIPLVNNSDYSWAGKSLRDYTSNDPLDPLNKEPGFISNNSFTVEGNLRIRFRQEYIDRPEGKYILGTKYPELLVNYRKAVKLSDTEADYDFIKLSLSDQMRFGLLGRFKYLISAGDYINKKSVFFMDAHHFNGNKTWFTSFGLDNFRNLDYYSNSTFDRFIEAHAEQNFGGLLLNKIPWVRKLNINEVAGVHYFYTEQSRSHTELSFGIEKLNFIRMEVYASFAEGKAADLGLVFGLRRTIGTQ